MEPKLFLELAKKLLTMSSEAAYRSAVSRAYYAVFHAAAVFLDKMGFATARSSQAHGQLPIRFNNCGTKDGVQMARWLKDLHRNRLSADYDLNSSDFNAQFKSAMLIAQAEQALLRLHALAASPNLCDQIRKGVRVYEEKLKA